MNEFTGMETRSWKISDCITIKLWDIIIQLWLNFSDPLAKPMSKLGCVWVKQTAVYLFRELTFNVLILIHEQAHVLFTHTNVWWKLQTNGTNQQVLKY